MTDHPDLSLADPLPLLAQIADRKAGDIQVSYLQRGGPNAWRLRLTHTR